MAWTSLGLNQTHISYPQSMLSRWIKFVDLESVENNIYENRNQNDVKLTHGTVVKACESNAFFAVCYTYSRVSFFFDKY